MVRAEGKFGKCDKCGTIYRFDESGYYFVKNEDDPTQTEDKEKIWGSDKGMAFNATPPSIQCDVCGHSLVNDDPHQFFVLHIEAPGHTESERVLEIFGKQAFNVCFVCILRALGVKELNKIEVGGRRDLIMDTPVVFGLLRQGHIPTIEIMLKEGATWEEIGKEIGWCPETAKEHYGWYVEASEKTFETTQRSKEMNGPNKKPTAIDLFCGAGGSTLGFKMAGFKVILAVDNNEVALSSYQANHPEVETFLMDIMELKAKDLPKADVILGSTPCQEFSTANFKRTYDMDLTHHFLKIIHDYKPKYWVLENVPGIAPYLHGVKYNILCAAEYGVPQKRYRCIAGNYPMPYPTHLEHGNQTLDNGNLKPWVKFGEIKHPDGAKTISKKGIAGAFKRAQKMWKKGNSFNIRFVDENDVLPTLLATEFHGLRSSSIIIWDECKLRRLSWIECIRTQSFPDNYIFNGTQAQRYHQVGDAVPPLLAKAIADAIRGDAL